METTNANGIVEVPKPGAPFFSSHGGTVSVLLIVVIGLSLVMPSSWRWFSFPISTSTIFRQWSTNADDDSTIASKPASSTTRTCSKSTATTALIPFILIQEPSKVSISSTLHYALRQYQSDMNKALYGLSQLLEQTLFLEQQQQEQHGITIPEQAKLSNKVQQRIEKSSKCLEHNAAILQQLLYELIHVIALPGKPCQQQEHPKKLNHEKQQSQQQHQAAQHHQYPPSTIFQMVDDKNPSQQNTNNNKATPLTLKKEEESNAYDSALQIVAHLVRDWTKLGANLRQNLYGWCREQVQLHVKSNATTAKVLVPGAGMGRLSHDIWQDGYTVEANELSPVMAAAAQGILQRNVQSTIHPFVLDAMSNEVDSKRRYDSVEFPDVMSSVGPDNNNTFSFTIGDFVGDYYLSQSPLFDAVVTCFFIDTAANIYDYIQLIHGLLKPKTGVWINVGPVQWHYSSILRPSVDELKDLLTMGGLFDVVHWSVDTEPIPYRQDDDGVFVRATDYSSYRPLRFVAIRKA